MFSAFKRHLLFPETKQKTKKNSIIITGIIVIYQKCKTNNFIAEKTEQQQRQRQRGKTLSLEEILLIQKQNSKNKNKIKFITFI